MVTDSVFPVIASRQCEIEGEEIMKRERDKGVDGGGKRGGAFSAKILAWSRHGDSRTRSRVIPLSTNLIDRLS